jgi:hypothetical protein
MLFNTIQGASDAAVVFIGVINANASRAMAAGEPVIWETATFADGLHVVDPLASNASGLMAGVIDSTSIPVGAVGRMQVYGKRNANTYTAAAGTVGAALAPSVNGTTPVLKTGAAGDVSATEFTVTAATTLASTPVFLTCL